MRRFVDSWAKFFADLSSTRIQITLVVIILWAVIVWHGIGRIKSAADAVALLNAITPVVIATVGAWFGGRWLAYNYDDKKR